MMKFMFTPRANLFDLIAIALLSILSTTYNLCWLAILLAIAGGVFSAIMEDRV